MPWEGSTGADNVATDFRTSRVPSEYKRVVGASFLKKVVGFESIHITTPIIRHVIHIFIIGY
jgi:hypothetical protein